MDLPEGHSQCSSSLRARRSTTDCTSSKCAACRKQSINTTGGRSRRHLLEHPSAPFETILHRRELLACDPRSRGPLGGSGKVAFPRSPSPEPWHGRPRRPTWTRP